MGDDLVDVFTFDNDRQEWRFYDPRPGLQDFSTIDILSAKDENAYIIDVRREREVVLNGTSRQLYPGNNHIPWGIYVGEDRQAVSIDAGLREPLGDNLIRVWSFDNQDNSWSFYDPRAAFAAAYTLVELETDKFKARIGFVQ